MQLDEIGTGAYTVLCICEGTAEQDVIESLLDDNRLIFRREHLLDGKVVRKRSAEAIENAYLSFQHAKPIAIIRILDSKRERFKLSKPYQERYKGCVFNVYTGPEIEVLLIIHKGDYAKYSNKEKSKIKPSVFCKQQYDMRDLKQKGKLVSCFSNLDELIAAIRTHRSYTEATVLTLNDLLS